jgi:hypothetical protein
MHNRHEDLITIMLVVGTLLELGGCSNVSSIASSNTWGGLQEPLMYCISNGENIAQSEQCFSTCISNVFWGLIHRLGTGHLSVPDGT